MNSMQSAALIILAGGKGSRMGGINKGLVSLNGIPLIEHLLARLQNQFQQVLISANHYAVEFQSYGFPVFTDQRPGQLGPLCGIESVMAQNPQFDRFFCCPVDSPFVSPELASRLFEAAETAGAPAAFPIHNQKAEPLHCCLRREALPLLTAFLDQDKRRVLEFLRSIGAREVDFSSDDSAFMNLNTHEDIQALQQTLLRKQTLERMR